MTWIVKKQNNGYLVTAKNHGSFLLNNKHDAERLCNKLNNFNSPWCEVSEKLIREGGALVSLGNELKNLGGMEK